MNNMRNPVTATPRLKPTSTRNYPKRRYQTGGEVTPTAEEMADKTTRQLDPRYWASIGKPNLPPTHVQFNWKTGKFE